MNELKWFSVKTMLPPPETEVLLYKDGRYFIGLNSIKYPDVFSKIINGVEHMYLDITHWKFLDKPELK